MLGLPPHDKDMLVSVFRRHPEVEQVILFGSRAKGTASPASDVDLAITGIEDPLKAESLAGELDELPLPYRFDVRSLKAITHAPLREHIERVGIVIYRRDPTWKAAESRLNP